MSSVNIPAIIKLLALHNRGYVLIEGEMVQYMIEGDNCGDTVIAVMYGVGPEQIALVITIARDAGVDIRLYQYGLMLVIK